MGFFSKIKDNLNHGGVKVKLNAPASASIKDASVNTTVSITATKSPAKIDSVKVELLIESQDQTNNAGQNPNQIIATAADSTIFNLQPGESREVPVKLLINIGKAIESNLPDGSGMKAVAHALEQLQNVSNAMDQNNRIYRIRATVNVDGIAIDPSDSMPIQILKPGEVGGAVNVRL